MRKSEKNKENRLENIVPKNQFFSKKKQIPEEKNLIFIRNIS